MSIHSRLRRWGVILAGGNGERLRSLTKVISGDDRPKQFCPLLPDGQTLLSLTRSRVARTVPAERTLFVVTRDHAPFYSSELANVAPDRIVVQPSNRGTLAAVLSSLAMIRNVNPKAVVAFFPSDHYYSREPRFIQGVHEAFAAADAAPQTVVLLGAKALYPEVGYGYIDPGEQLLQAGRLKRVERFWEKPSASLAPELLHRGCLWNTFVMAGRVDAFLGLIEGTETGIYRSFEPAFAHPGDAHLQDVYDRIPPCDFSKQVLSSGIDRIGVLDLGDIGWSDLGDPHRLIATLSEHGIPSPWRQLWLREMGIAAVAS